MTLFIIFRSNVSDSGITTNNNSTLLLSINPLVTQYLKKKKKPVRSLKLSFLVSKKNFNKNLRSYDTILVSYNTHTNLYTHTTCYSLFVCFLFFFFATSIIVICHVMCVFFFNFPRDLQLYDRIAPLAQTIQTFFFPLSPLWRHFIFSNEYIFLLLLGISVVSD